MYKSKVIELGEKFAHEHNQKWQEQRDRLETFYFDTSRFFRNLINEMDGDLLVLKHKDVHEDVIKMFSKFTHDLLKLYLDIDPTHPYAGMEKLVNWVDSKQTKNLLENLEFLIQTYLKKEKIEFEQTPNMKHPQFSSIQKLLTIIPKLRNFMVEHPMLPDPRSVSTVPPPMKGFLEPSLGPNDPTAIFPVNVLEDIPAE